jgi:hypothetical protein
MPKFTGRHMETVIWPKLKAGEKFVIWLVHDESCFCTDGGPVKVWIESGHTYMTPKRGSTIHVLAIISPFGLEHKETIEPGKSTSMRVLSFLSAFSYSIIHFLICFTLQMRTAIGAIATSSSNSTPQWVPSRRNSTP